MSSAFHSPGSRIQVALVGEHTPTYLALYIYILRPSLVTVNQQPRGQTSSSFPRTLKLQLAFSDSYPTRRLDFHHHPPSPTELDTRDNRHNGI